MQPFTPLLPLALSKSDLPPVQASPRNCCLGFPGRQRGPQQICEHLLEPPAAASPPASLRPGPGAPRSRTIGRLIPRTMATMRQTHIITPATAGTKASRRRGTVQNKNGACCFRAISLVPGNLLSKVAVGAQGCKSLGWCVGRTHGYWM